MFELVLLGVAGVLIASVTFDLNRAQRIDQPGAQSAGEEKEPRRRARGRPR